MHKFCQLTVTVGKFVPVEQRRIKWNAPVVFRVVRIADNNRITFYYRTHRLTCFFCIFRWHSCNRRHENTVYFFLCQITQMAMYQFCRETHSIRRYRTQPVFIHNTITEIRQLHIKTQCTPEGFPVRHILPVKQYARQTNSNMSVQAKLRIRIFLEQKLFTNLIEIGHRILRAFYLFYLGTHCLILRIAYNFATFTAITCYKASAIGELYNCTITMVYTERARHIAFLIIGKQFQRIKTNKIALRKSFLLPFLFCEQRSTNGTHFTGIRCTGYIAASNILLQCTQYRIIFEGTALHHNFITQYRSVADTHNFGKYIFNNRTA